MPAADLPDHRRVVVIGGGISGLAAAWELSAHLPGTDVALLEATDRVGGKLRGQDIAGVRVDVGAESMLARRPEALTLIEEVGLSAGLVHPATTSASIASRGALHPLPPRTMMGIPADPERATGLLTPAEVQRAGTEALPGGAPEAPDISVGEFVEQRLGPAVVDQIVEPLLGGVYAGHARLTSLRAALPAIAPAYRDGTSLTAAVDAVMPHPPEPGTAATPARAPVFAGLRGGVHRIAEGVVDALAARGVQVLTDTTVRQIERTGNRWRLVTGPVPDPRALTADHIVLALPPAPTARLLAPHLPRAASALGEVETASMAVVTLAFDTSDLPDLPGSGVLVPPAEGRHIKASTFSANKWAWIADAGRAAGSAGGDVTVLRASLGRHREEHVLQVSDDELVTRSLGDLGEVLATRFPPPVATHVQRWGGGLPQYFVGHTDRIERIMADVATLRGVELAGATYQGVGIPACIASGRAAAARVLAEESRAPIPPA